jgi:hypothetical protein
MVQSQPKLSKLHRWILVEAYREIRKAGTDEPQVTERTSWADWKHKVHLPRIVILQRYFNLPVRPQSIYDDDSPLVIAGTEIGRKAHASLGRSLRRLKQRGLIEEYNRVVLTAEGIQVAKALVDQARQVVLANQDTARLASSEDSGAIKRPRNVQKRLKQ